jgi:hypothetical protein
MEVSGQLRTDLDAVVKINIPDLCWDSNFQLSSPLSKAVLLRCVFAIFSGGATCPTHLTLLH